MNFAKQVCAGIPDCLPGLFCLDGRFSSAFSMVHALVVR
jgi:hypothetical protein